ncbi:MAG TPA: DUF1844 domain-containing protein [Candidatus Brocadiia bacterium]|nr:DUF1844 domain-containing protein [Planctomycetota bacterium]MDO8092431.1 DUF1844 domain-containing protein [Candidatus Brocadiales bacterium]
MTEEEKKIDEDWKKQIQQEKEKIDEELKASSSDSPSTGKKQIPQANFTLFISGLATQSYILLGLIENPLTKQKEKDINQAKYLIDILNILEEKTKGNLTKDEQNYFKSLMYDLRMAFVECSK